MVPLKHLLGLRFPQQIANFLLIVVDGVLADLLFVILVVLFDALC